MAAAGVLRRVFEPAIRHRGIVACALEVGGRQAIVVDAALSSWQASAAVRIARERGTEKTIAFVELADLPPAPRVVRLPRRPVTL